MLPGSRAERLATTVPREAKKSLFFRFLWTHSSTTPPPPRRGIVESVNRANCSLEITCPASSVHLPSLLTKDSPSEALNEISLTLLHSGAQVYRR